MRPSAEAPRKRGGNKTRVSREEGTDSEKDLNGLRVLLCSDTAKEQTPQKDRGAKDSYIHS